MIDHDERKLFAEKLLDLANITIGGAFIGQLVSEKRFSAPIAIGGVIIAGVLYWISHYLMKKKRG